MKITKILFAFVLVMSVSFVTGQDDERRLLMGKVIYKNINVANEYVINSTSEKATVTNEEGEFAIEVKVGDELAFTAVNYQYKLIQVTQEILDNNRLVVTVNEKVTELDEVVITPDDPDRFMKVKNEEFKGFEYEIDRTSGVENVAMSDTDRGMQDGANFVNIFRALFQSKDVLPKDGPKLRVSQVLRQVYDNEFFVSDLSIPADKIDAFLFYCDVRMPATTLLKKENEFQLIDSLVNHSKTFLAEIDEE
jgi:hypothetical protein